eukprot:CAMPEP_0174854670 /NCGR_PEP_ID=MMETSP1114-20130205/31889_1 /TAXON_ID=312471 /ORGANISM="Neobodo designis, Strain CCAP 1951/1" /LENGTH=406 /DNA_ID=CAMNT_0016089381 /DNA_START=27 /DNA_END=1247 /DNA_ORIENTATION=+
MKPRPADEDEFEVFAAIVEGESTWWLFRPSAPVSDEWTSASGHWYYPAEDFEQALLEAHGLLKNAGDRGFVRREKGTVDRDGVFRGRIPLRWVKRNRDLEHCAVLSASEAVTIDRDFTNAVEANREYEAKRAQQQLEDLENTSRASSEPRDAPGVSPGVCGFFACAASRVPGVRRTDALALVDVREGTATRLYIELAPGSRTFLRSRATPVDAASQVVFQTLGTEVAPTEMAFLASPFHDGEDIVVVSEAVTKDAQASSLPSDRIPEKNKRKPKSQGSLAALAQEPPKVLSRGAAGGTSAAKDESPPSAKSHRSESASVGVTVSRARCCGMRCWTSVGAVCKSFSAGDQLSDTSVSAAPVVCGASDEFITESNVPEADAGDNHPSTDDAKSTEYLADLLDCIQSTK